MINQITHPYLPAKQKQSCETFQSGKKKLLISAFGSAPRRKSDAKKSDATFCAQRLTEFSTPRRGIAVSLRCAAWSNDWCQDSKCQSSMKNSIKLFQRAILEVLFCSVFWSSITLIDIYKWQNVCEQTLWMWGLRQLRVECSRHILHQLILMIWKI